MSRPYYHRSSRSVTSEQTLTTQMSGALLLGQRPNGWSNGLESPTGSREQVFGEAYTSEKPQPSPDQTGQAHNILHTGALVALPGF